MNRAESVHSYANRYISFRTGKSASFDLNDRDLITSINFLHNFENRTFLCRSYPELARIAKSAAIQYPEMFAPAKEMLAKGLQESGQVKDKHLRLSLQARFIDLLLEISERDFKGFGVPLPAATEKIFISQLEKFINPATKSRRGKIFGLNVPDFYENQLTVYRSTGLMNRILSTNDYLNKGFNFHYMLDLFYLDLALEASNISTNFDVADQSFSCALLDISAPNSPYRKEYFRNFLSQLMKINFEVGFITPPPIKLIIKNTAKSLYPETDFTSNDPAYYYDLIERMLTKHGAYLTRALRLNPVWTKTFRPEQYLRYGQLFESLKKTFGDSLDSILEMGCSTFGAAVTVQTFFPKSTVLGCDLLPEDVMFSILDQDVLDRIKEGKMEYLQWNIREGVVNGLSEITRKLQNRHFDVAMLLNSAYPHMRGTANSYLGRVAAIEAAIKKSTKGIVVAGGSGLHRAYAASNAMVEKPDTHANGWIFLKNATGGLDTEGILYT